MKKFFKFLCFIPFVTLSGPVFAQTSDNEPIFDTVIANTDAQLAAAMDHAAYQYQAIALPIPPVPVAGSADIRLADISEQCISNFEIVSAYPGLYKVVPNVENIRIIKVFRFNDSRGNERRVEVYYTGGDWMQYGYTYFGVNAEHNEDRADAYFISDLSTSDSESGAVPPAVNPFDFTKLAQFIADKFLNADGDVRTAFKRVVSAPISAK